MKGIVQLIFLLLLCFQLNAQQGFVKAYNFGYPTALRFTAMTTANDSSLVVCGHIVDSMPPYQLGIFFSKIDTLGQLLEFKSHYNMAGLNYAVGAYPSGLIKLSDSSGYIFIGNISENSGGFMTKLDLEGNEIWTQILEDNSSLQGFYSQILELENGFLVAGIKQRPADAQTDIFLMKTDKQGNKLWENFYGAVGNGESMQSLVYLNENEYVIGGRRSASQGSGWQNAHSKVQIFAVDSLGDEKWYWESDPEFEEWAIEDLGCYGLHQDGEGNWVYVTVRGEWQGNVGNPPLFFKQPKFVMRDSTFNLIFEQTYDEVDGPDNEFLNLIQLDDGDWLGMGISREELPTGDPVPAHNYGWLKRISNGQDGISNLGDSLWCRLDLTFPDSNFYQEQFIHSAVELPSGSIIAAGYFSNFSIANQSDHGLLIKVNQHGCLDTTNCIPTNFPNIIIAANEPTIPDLKVYPNPASHILHIESDLVPVWDKVELLDMTGRVVDVVFNNKEITLSGLPSGMYVLRLWKGERFWTRRIIRQ